MGRLLVWGGIDLCSSMNAMSVPPPEILGLILMILGWVTFLVVKVMVATEAFEVSSGWGWVSLLVPFGELIFIFKYWKRARDPFIASLIGILIMVAGAWVSYGPVSTA